MSTRLSVTHLSRTTACLALALAGCGAPAEDVTPRVNGLSSNTITLGEVLKFSGHNFAKAKVDPITNEIDGRTRLQFEGVYDMKYTDGHKARQWVDLKIAPDYEGELTSDGAAHFQRVTSGETGVTLPDVPEQDNPVLRWNRFGPFENPFADQFDAPATGSFTGTIRAVTTYPDGSTVSDPNPPEVTLHVASSIVIEMLEPVVGIDDSGNVITPNCGHPALRALQGLPYVMQVRAMGFTPVRFTYQFSGITRGAGATFTHDVSFPVDRVGDPAWHQDEMIVFEQLADDVEFGVSTITVIGEDAAGQAYYNVLPISVVRPLQFKTDAVQKLAEYKEPVPVWGPIIGGLHTSVGYSESTSESRQQGVAVNISNDFTKKQGLTNTQQFSQGIETTDTISEQKSEGTAESTTESNSETYGTTTAHTEGTNVGYNTTDGTTWDYKVTDTDTHTIEDINEAYSSNDNKLSAGGGIEIPLLSWFTGKVGYDYTHGSGNKDTTRTGDKHEETTAETNGQNHSEQHTYGTTVNDTQGTSFAGTYGVASQSTINRTTSHTEANSQAVTYKMGTEASLEESFTTGQSEAYNQSWVSTVGLSTSFSFNMSVPRGRCGEIYRQTIRFARTATIYAHNLCGVREPIADMTFSEWQWGIGAGISDDCSTGLAPAMAMPAAACFIGCQ